MWINLFTITLAIAIGFAVAAMLLQQGELQHDEIKPKGRRAAHRRIGRVRG